MGAAKEEDWIIRRRQSWFTVGSVAVYRYDLDNESHGRRGRTRELERVDPSGDGRPIESAPSSSVAWQRTERSR